MKNSIKNLEVKSIKNTKAVKGGAYGRGDRSNTTTGSNRAELM